MFKRAATSTLIALSIAAVAMLLTPNSKATSAARCRNVRGHLVSQSSTTDCPSPIALCAEGHFYGGIIGDLKLVATTLTPTQDTPLTGVFLYTADDVIKTREGDIYTKDAGALNLAPGSTGDDMSIVTITGGTGEYAGATGRLRAYGTFSGTTGEFNYEGEICTQ